MFQRVGEVGTGLGYVTETLPKLGQRLAAALRWKATLHWIPYALLWFGLATCVAFVVLAYKLVGLQSVRLDIASQKFTSLIKINGSQLSMADA